MSRVYKMICEKDTSTGLAFGGGGGGGGGGARYSRRVNHNTPVGAHRRGEDRSPVTARIENYPGDGGKAFKKVACKTGGVVSFVAPKAVAVPVGVTTVLLCN
ncbi:hypothetical protein DBZ36_11030 [Alginatibacterium sediminis]|uniref:Uncharacterized protein n=1 Tax=Alginatibacterium sediminis TaxID=2164068 RepID=A0A420EAR6_9ALTE|nr:hypothetical protein [Alginatibacterium sediminis]RKF17789.1 hypothetical protein DBZ36_11030 [Alginatibacterium sediminis]